MKKINKSIIKIIIIAIIIILGTTVNNKVYAIRLNYNILNSGPWWYCSAYGFPLPSSEVPRNWSESIVYIENSLITNNPQDTNAVRLRGPNVADVISVFRNIMGGGSAEGYDAMAGNYGGDGAFGYIGEETYQAIVKAMEGETPNPPEPDFSPVLSDDGQTYVLPDDKTQEDANTGISHGPYLLTGAILADFHKRGGKGYGNAAECYILFHGDGYNNRGSWQRKWWTQPAGRGVTHPAYGTIDSFREENTNLAINYDNSIDISESYSLINNMKKLKKEDITKNRYNAQTTNFASNSSQEQEIEWDSNESLNLVDNVGSVVNLSGLSSYGSYNSWISYIERGTGRSNAVCGNDGFKLNYKPNWYKETEEYKYPQTIFNSSENVFIVGPFRIDYLQYGKFAGITDMDIYTDAPGNSKLDKNMWEIYNCTGTVTVDGKKLPSSKKKFYIKIKNIPNITKIIGIHAEFHYVNAYACYQLYESSENGYQIGTCKISMSWIQSWEPNQETGKWKKRRI